jgi:ESCRT-I complex subunit VPS28
MYELYLSWRRRPSWTSNPPLQLLANLTPPSPAQAPLRHHSFRSSSCPLTHPKMSYPSYAPSPYSLPRPLSIANLDAEQKLFTTASERELYESLAELHAIIVTLEFLEKAFVKDSIPSSSYTPVCKRLLGQYQTLLGNDKVAEAFGDLATFKEKYDIDCPAATRRLITGVPATTEHPAVAVEEARSEGGRTPEITASSGNGGHQEGKWKNVSPKAVAEATQNFITCMDALRLNYSAKDELHPLLAAVITSVNVVTKSEEFDGRKDIVKWLIVLNQMRPGDEIDENQGREMLWDLEKGYNSFIEGLG